MSVSCVCVCVCVCVFDMYMCDIIESVDSISRDGLDTPHIQVIHYKTRPR